MGIQNFKQDIIDKIGKENVDKAEIVVFGSDRINNDRVPKDAFDKVFPLKDMLKYLDYSYNDGYGGQECHDIYIWVNGRVYHIHEYDGSTSIQSVPSSPKDYHKWAIIRNL